MQFPDSRKPPDLSGGFTSRFGKPKLQGVGATNRAGRVGTNVADRVGTAYWTAWVLLHVRSRPSEVGRGRSV